MGILDLAKLGLILMAALFIGGLALNFGMLLIAAILAGASGIYEKFSKKNKLFGVLAVAAVTLMVLLAVQTVVGVFHHSVQASSKPTVAAGSQCVLPTANFISQVNTLRVSHGLKPVKEDANLDIVANLRIADMKAYHYYGHVNPTSKLDVQPLIQAHTSYQNYGEILDGPLGASEAFNDFAGSPEHYAILTNANITSVGVASSYQPEVVGSYDENGARTSSAAVGNFCYVVSELAF